MAMDWANERFVLLYTRDTVTWKLLTWEARAVLMFLFRKVDRAGVIELGPDGLDGLAALIEVPVEVLERTVPQLTRAERATVTIRDGWLALPNFLDAQETPRSDRQRKRDSRETRRDVALACERGLLSPETAAAVTKRDTTVTVGHAESRTVTPTLTLPDPIYDPLEGSSGAAESGFALSAPGKATKARGARPIPTDWTPDLAHAEDARRLGLDLGDQANRMRDWAIGKGVRRTDWDAVFRNWLRRAADDRPRGTSAGRGLPEV